MEANNYKIHYFIKSKETKTPEMKDPQIKLESQTASLIVKDKWEINYLTIRDRKQICLFQYYHWV